MNKQAEASRAAAIAKLERQTTELFQLVAVLRDDLDQHTAESYHTAHESLVGHQHPRPDDR